MSPANRRMIYWAPRALGMAYALFISIFALGVFGAGLPLTRQLLALAIHLIPAGIVVFVLAFDWKWEWLGFVGFIALGLLYIWITCLRFPVPVYLVISGPAFLVGVRFLASWLLRRKAQPVA